MIKHFAYFRICDYFTTFIAVIKGLGMIDLQHIIQSKRELLGRETYSRTPINYSEGMAEDQKDRYIQYLAE